MTMAGLVENIICLIAFVAVMGGLILAMDDLWIDLYAFFYDLKPKELTPADLKVMDQLPQKRVAIMIANWREHDVLAAMVSGNVSQLDYNNYTFYVGVYPNDPETWRVARDLETRYPQVRVIVNSKPGPTTKGQMLNEMARGIIKSEQKTGLKHDLFLLQDSEDVLHPRSLKLINMASQGADFVQVPVFSFDVPAWHLVGGTYLDEFSEIHTKDLLVRDRMGAAVPSAGVGTAMSRRLVRLYMKRQAGDLLREDTLTEDYDLGLMAKLRGLKTRFVCAYVRMPDGHRDFIATREFFPDRLRASVKQKTRWTLGIVFQGARNLGWRGGWVDRYFLFRDRRGPINACLIGFAMITLAVFVISWLLALELPPFLRSEFFMVLASINAASMVIRIAQRMRAVLLVNGWRQALAVPLRWPVGNLVNSLAAFHAFKGHLISIHTGLAPKWEKTTHVMPVGFGLPKAIAAPVAPTQLQLAGDMRVEVR